MANEGWMWRKISPEEIIHCQQCNLYRAAMRYGPFTDWSRGQALCKSCLVVTRATLKAAFKALLADEQAFLEVHPEMRRRDKWAPSMRTRSRLTWPSR